MKRLTLFAIMIVFVAVPIVFWSRTLTPGISFAIYLNGVSRLFALIGFVLLIFQYLLSSKIKWLERGMGPGRLFGIHRKCGFGSIILILLHPICLLASEKLMGYSSPLGPLKIIGVFTLFVLLIASGAAIFNNRLHLKRETWKNIHKANYAIFPLGFAHSFFLGSDLLNWPLRIFWLLMGFIYMAVLLFKTWKWFTSRLQIK
ncbi:ferric reductase-like transmembrane domain-containing protein [Thermodesulfobacteriota bacterium]